MHEQGKLLGGGEGEVLLCHFLPRLVCGDLESSTWSTKRDQLKAFVCMLSGLPCDIPQGLPHHSWMIASISWHLLWD